MRAWTAALAVTLTSNMDAGQGPIFRSQTDLVALNVTVLDARGTLVGGLAKEAFSIAEDGEPRTIAHFTADCAPISLVIALDTSESMQGARFTVARQAVLRFFEMQGPDDEIAVIGFNDRVFSIAPLTRLSSTVSTALEYVTPAGATALYDAVDSARKQAEPTGGFAVVVRSLDAVPEAAERVAAELQKQYVIGFARHTSMTVGFITFV